MADKRQDTVRFTFKFPHDAKAIEYELAAVRHVPSAEDPLIHRLAQEELGDVLAKLGWENVRSLAERVVELQAIVDKRKDPREWDSIQELFHPDMNIAGIHAAIVALLLVYEKSTKPTSDSYAQLKQALANATEKLWEGRPTQLEKDQAASPTSPRVNESDAKHPSREQAVAAAVALWDLLDMIDSLGDEIKPSDLDGYKQFYRRATGLTSLRSQHMASDGHVLLWPYATHAAVFKHTRSVVAPTLHAPVPMLLHCPICHTKHIDEGEFATKPHHTHACQGFLPLAEGEKRPRRCGHVWRPAIAATVGVEALPGFLNAERPDGDLRVERMPTGITQHRFDGSRWFTVLPGSAKICPQLRVLVRNYVIDGKAAEGLTSHSPRPGVWIVRMDAGFDQEIPEEDLQVL